MIKRKIFLASFLCLSLIFIYSVGVLGSLAASESDDPTVTLITSNGQASFTINRSDNKLFGDYSGAMPGDTITNTVKVASSSVNSGNFNIYLYAVAAEASNKDFLNAMSLMVKNKVNTELKVLNAASSNNAKGVLLGTFRPGDSDILTISFTLPIDMGNSFQGTESIVEWHFYAEQVISDGGVISVITPDNPVPSPTPTPMPSSTPTEIPDDDTPTGDLPVDIGTEPVPTGDSPQTGDSSNLLMWVIIMVGSGSALTAILTFERKYLFKSHKNVSLKSSNR